MYDTSAMAQSEHPLVSEWLKRVLSDTKDHAVLLVSPEGEVLAWLGASERLFGHSAAEAVGQPFGAIFLPEDRELSLHLQEMAVARCVGRSEDDRWHLRKDTSRFWGSGVLEAVLHDDGRLLGYCKIVRDRTDMRTQLDALQNALGTRRDDDRGPMAQLAHELRNTVAPVFHAVHVLRRSEDAEVRTRMYDVLERQLAVMKRLLDDMARDSAGARWPDLVLERITLQDALRLAHEAVRPSALQRGQELLIVLPGPPILIEVDAARLHQMLINLLGNAIKYTPEGGRVSLTATVEGATAVIRVEDNGMGISPDVLPRIFELFTREDRLAGRAEGLGVGLSIVKEYAVRHGGSVEARSPGPGKGCSVSLRLPLEQPAPGAERGQKPGRRGDGQEPRR